MAENVQYTPPPHMDAVALIRRASAQLRAWHEKYAEWRVEWLPPAGDVRWLEDADAKVVQWLSRDDSEAHADALYDTDGVLATDEPRYVWAWMHEEDEARVISAAQKAQALSDGGASASSVRPYSVPLYKDACGVPGTRPTGGMALSMLDPKPGACPVTNAPGVTGGDGLDRAKFLADMERNIEQRTAGVGLREPCPRGDDNPEPSCTNRHQCWEPCGELGNDEKHVRVGRQDPAIAGVQATSSPLGYVHKDWEPKHGQGRIYGHCPGPDYVPVIAGVQATFWCHEESHEKSRCTAQCAECAELVPHGVPEGCDFCRHPPRTTALKCPNIGEPAWNPVPALALLVNKLARRLSKLGDPTLLAAQATEFLRREGLTSPLRTGEPSRNPVANQGESSSSPVREPLTDAEVFQLLEIHGIPCDPETAAAIAEIVERAHGIGGQR